MAVFLCVKMYNEKGILRVFNNKTILQNYVDDKNKKQNCDRLHSEI